MKRKLIITTALLVGTFAVTLPARADHRPRFGFFLGLGHGGGYVRVGYESGRSHKHYGHYKRAKHYKQRKHYRHTRPYLLRHRYQRPHTCVRTPVYTRTWVEPVYRTQFHGYDPCGRPVYRNVLVTRGYFRQVVSHYRCGRCGVTYGAP